MLSRPTTEQILLDCCVQLREKVAPALSDPGAVVAAQMLEEVLRNCAVRAAHEIEWMREESEALVAFAREVASSSLATPAITDALQRHRTGVTESLHLDDVTAAYALAGASFAAALDAVTGAGEVGLTVRARALLDERLEHENQITGEWGFVGRA